MITESGQYKVKIHTGDIQTINVTKRDGELGVSLNAINKFIKVTDFVKVEVLSRED